MGRKVFRGIGNIVACFEEPNVLGDVLDIDAPRNAPMKDPINYLSLITWHSALDQFELAVAPVDVTIGHTAQGIEITNIGINTLIIPASSGARESDILLYSHGLGYKPKVKVTISGQVINPGQILQNSASYRRSVSVYVTTAGVYLRELAWAKDATLPAHSQTYRVYIFRQVSADPSKSLFSKVGALLTLARGIVRSTGRYLRRTGAGDQEFSMDSGPTLDIANGHKRVANGGVLTTEPGYTGSMPAPAYVRVGL